MKNKGEYNVMYDFKFLVNQEDGLRGEIHNWCEENCKKRWSWFFVVNQTEDYALMSLSKEIQKEIDYALLKELGLDYNRKVKELEENISNYGSVRLDSDLQKGTWLSFENEKDYTLANLRWAGSN